MNVVGDAAFVEELVELLVIDPVRALDLAVWVGRSRADVDVANIQALEVPVEMRPELSAVIGLDHGHTERQAPQHLLDEADGGGLVARIVNLEHADPDAVV